MQYRNYLPRIPLWHLVLTYCKSGAEGNRMAQPNGRLQSSAADQNPMKAGHPSASIKIYRYSFCCPGCHTCAKEISIFRPDRTIQQQGRCHRRPIPFVSPGNSGFCGVFYRRLLSDNVSWPINCTATMSVSSASRHTTSDIPRAGANSAK